MNKRIIFDIIIFFTIFFLPWWFVLFLALIGSFMWAPYYEIIALGVVADVLYGADTLLLGGLMNLLAAIAIIYISSYAKEAVR